MPRTRTAALSIFLSSLVLTGVLWSTPASAAPTLKQAREHIARISHWRARAEKIFPGPAGLTGVLLEIRGRKMIGWLTADDQYLLLGNLIGPCGASETRASMEHLGLISKPMPAAKFALSSVRANGFTVGRKGPLLTVFIDPNCIYCHKFYAQIMPLVKAGRVRVRFIPVAFLKSSSAGKSAALLTAKDPAAALAKNEKGFDIAREEGGVTPVANPSAAVQAKVKTNTELLAKAGQVATPTLLYCNRQGKPVLLQGLPKGTVSRMMKTIGPFRDGRCTPAG